MMVICDASDVIKYDRRTLGLCNAPLDMEYHNNSIE